MPVTQDLFRTGETFPPESISAGTVFPQAPTSGHPSNDAKAAVPMTHTRQGRPPLRLAILDATPPVERHPATARRDSVRSPSTVSPHHESIHTREATQASPPHLAPHPSDASARPKPRDTTTQTSETCEPFLARTVHTPHPAASLPVQKSPHPVSAIHCPLKAYGISPLFVCRKAAAY